MKSNKELLVELCEQNTITKLARQLDIRYHKETLIPRYLKEKDKKIREQKVQSADNEIKQLEILVKDLNDIIKFNKEMIDKEK